MGINIETKWTLRSQIGWWLDHLPFLDKLRGITIRIKAGTTLHLKRDIYTPRFRFDSYGSDRIVIEEGASTASHGWAIYADRITNFDPDRINISWDGKGPWDEERKR